MSKSSTRIRDLELAVGALSMLVERLVVGDKKYKGAERDLMLGTAATARMLVNCGHMELSTVDKHIAAAQANDARVDEIVSRIADGAGAVARAAGIKEKIEPDKYEGKRFFIDLPSGDSYSTDDVVESLRMYESGQALNIYDRKLGCNVVYQGIAVAYPANPIYGNGL